MTQEMTLQNVMMLGMILLILSGCTAQTTLVMDTDDSITIGVIAPLSGKSALWGTQITRGLEIYSESNSDVSFIFEDSRGEPAVAVIAANKLIHVDNVDYLITVLSPVSQAVAPISQENNIRMVATMAVSSDISKTGDHIFKLWSNEFDASEAILEKTNVSKAVVLHTNDAYGVQIKKAFEDKVLSTHAYEIGTTEFQDILVKAMNDNPNMLIFAGSLPQEIIGVSQSMKERGIAIPIVEASALLSLESIRSKAYLPKGSTTLTFDNQNEDTWFTQKYVELYGEPPIFVVAHFAYDSADFLHNKRWNQSVFETMQGPASIPQSGEISPGLTQIVLT